jgi:hypothetical protein
MENLVISLFVGYLLGRFLLSIADRYFQEKLELHEALVKKISDVVHPVKVEKHGDITYWFDADTDRFIAQGYTQEEIVEVLKKRWTKHIFIISPNEMMIGPNFDVTPFTERDLQTLASK